LQAFPGINGIGEGSGNLSVRGANGDHNLILLDEAPVYNPAHFLGIFSIFNPDAVKAVSLQRGYISPAHRGRLGSVLSIRMKEGSTEEHDYAAGIGLLSARARAEGPLFGGAGSFMVAARRTYPDLLVKWLAGNRIGLGLVFFYDLNAKANYRFDDKNRLFLSTYLGRDVFDFGENFTINWGNQTLTLRWNHLFNERLFSNTSLILSDFDYRSSTDLGELVNDDNLSAFTLRTRIQDAHLKQDFHFYPHPDHTFQFGWSLINHNFIPGRLKNELEPLPELDNSPERRALESGLYFAHSWDLSRKLRLEYGFHLSGLGVYGSDGWVYDYAEGEKQDSFWVGKDETLQRWGGAEPRLLLSYRPTSNRTFTLAASRTIQYLQLLPSAFINNPASVWLPSSNNIRPQKGLLLAVGFLQEFGQRRWLLSLDAYLNHFDNQIAYRDGAQLLTGLELESQLIYGSADFRGVELLLRKKAGRLRGWLSYALSEAVYHFPDAGDGRPFPGDQHRPHAFNATLLFDLKPHCTLSAAWRYLSGKPVTVPAGKYRFNEQVLDFFSGRNNFTTSNHHRLDIGLRWWKIGKRGARKTWSLSVFNAYGRRNPSFVYFEPREQGNQVYEISLLGWLPSFSWDIQF
ncbi:MAG: TonB-dependent receptor, partial [Bacteroidetes bacterium]